MALTTTASAGLLSRLPALLDPLIQRFAARPPSTTYGTRDSATDLFARAARYECVFQRSWTPISD